MSATEEEEKPAFGGGTLLFAGATDWAFINRGGGKSAKKKDPAVRFSLQMRHQTATSATVKIHCLNGFALQRATVGLLGWQADAERAERYPNLVSPTRLKVLHDVKVMWVAAGPSACHSVIGDSEGKCWTWGRNEVHSNYLNPHISSPLCKSAHRQTRLPNCTQHQVACLSQSVTPQQSII